MSATADRKQCISKWISELHAEHPDWKDKQIVAVAYDKCEASKDDFQDGFCPYKILSKLHFIQGVENHLYQEDFSDLPTSIRISNAVNNYLPKLQNDFPSLDEVGILKMGYDMARGILRNSDFETVEEAPVYFEIWVEDPLAFELALKTQFLATGDFTEGMIDFTNDNIYKIDSFSLSTIKPAVKFRKEDLEEEKLNFFKKVAEDDTKNLPPIFIDENNQIWDGHHRYYSLKRLGYKEIYAVQLPESILKLINYSDYLDSWNFDETSNINTTRFDTLLNRDLRKLDDFTDDKAATQFFAQDKPVTSSNVAEIGYENGKLRIFFRSGGGYEYPVPSSWYVEMLNAPSKGKFVWDSLRGRVPGRVIDNPTKITPGGVGGSIVPYFKIKGARMAPDAMRKSVRGFLKAARKGRARVSGVPIRRIPKPEFKAFTQFLAGQAGRFKTEGKAKRTFKKISKKATGFAKRLVKGARRKKDKKKKERQKERASQKEDKTVIREQIKRLRKILENSLAADLDDSIIKSIRRRIAVLQKRMSDFILHSDGLYDFYNMVDDFTDDMKYFYGPITRAGDFEYGTPMDPKIKSKNKTNLTNLFTQYKHLPSFDSHHENEILGFAYNFTDDPELYMKSHPKYQDLIGKDYFFTEGYAFNDIESVAEIPIVSNETELPVSIRFLDQNEGTGSSEQDISKLIHLAISVNQTDQDRCSSAGGNPCFITFHDKQATLPMEQLAGDFMPDKDEKKKDAESPKDDKKGSSKDKKDGKEDKTKSDPPMDAEFKSEEKDKKDFDDDYIKVKKSAFIELNKDISDMRSDFKAMKHREGEREKADNQLALAKIKGDFAEKTQTYIVNSDFLTAADLPTMQILEKALVKFEAPVDGKAQLFTRDFDDKNIKLQTRLQNMYGVSDK